MDRNACQEAGYHRRRQKIGDPAELQHSSSHKHGADEQGEGYGHRSERSRASGGESGQRSGEYRRNGRVGSGSQDAARAQSHKAYRGADEGIEPDLWLEATELRRRHLFGNGNGRQC